MGLETLGGEKSFVLQTFSSTLSPRRSAELGKMPWNAAFLGMGLIFIF